MTFKKHKVIDRLTIRNKIYSKATESNENIIK